MIESIQMVNYFDKKLSISLSVPETWRVGENEAFDLFFIAPEDEGYRTNLGFSILKGEGELNAEIFMGIIERTRANQAQEYPQFKEMISRKTNIDGRPTWLQQYQWVDSDSQSHFAQILGLIAANPQTIIEINGATLKEMEGEYLPILIEMVESIRLIPNGGMER
ncbi:MAG: hypothetical protein AAF633_00385 [Chloroflexota bacterium]